jgi:acetamidase/formamidase
MRQMSTQHSLDARRVHHDWDNSREPVLAIQPGDVVDFELLMAGARQVFETSTVDEVDWDFDTICRGRSCPSRRTRAAAMSTAAT